MLSGVTSKDHFKIGHPGEPCILILWKAHREGIHGKRTQDGEVQAIMVLLEKFYSYHRIARELQSTGRQWSGGSTTAILDRFLSVQR